MLQVANGGDAKVQDNGEEVDFFNNSVAYLEPGFNILFPLEMTFGEADVLYVLLRKREDIDGEFFSTLMPSDFSVTVTDATTGEVLEAELTLNTINPEWDQHDFSPLVLSIFPVSLNKDNQDQKIRSLQVLIKERGTNAFVFFKVVLNTGSRPFAFLPVELREEESRPKTASFATTALLDLFDNGQYILLSPFATFEEVEPSEADFSYPPGQVFYQLEKAANMEDYSFAVTSVSHEDVPDNVQIKAVPQFPKVAVLTIDGNLKREMADEEGIVFVEITSTGVSSGSQDVFKIFFAKSRGICVI